MPWEYLQESDGGVCDEGAGKGEGDGGGVLGRVGGCVGGGGGESYLSAGEAVSEAAWRGVR